MTRLYIFLYKPNFGTVTWSEGTNKIRIHLRHCNPNRYLEDIHAYPHRVYRLLYYISAEASRPSLSIFGPTQHRFWLPEQPGLYLEQDGACLEQTGSVLE